MALSRAQGTFRKCLSFPDQEPGEYRSYKLSDWGTVELEGGSVHPEVGSVGAGHVAVLSCPFHPEEARWELRGGHTGSGYTWKGEEVNGECPHPGLHTSQGPSPAGPG